jgi:V/A-type H+-transporting ATPase subunit K
MVLVLLTIGIGLLLNYTQQGTDRKGMKKILRANVLAFVYFMVMVVIILVPDEAAAVGENGVSSPGLGFIAAAISTGLATLGAGYAVGAVGSSALGAVSEDPKILGKTLIFVGLAEGIAIYGLIISILILGRL